VPSVGFPDRDRANLSHLGVLTTHSPQSLKTPGERVRLGCYIFHRFVGGMFDSSIPDVLGLAGELCGTGATLS